MVVCLRGRGKRGEREEEGEERGTFCCEECFFLSYLFSLALNLTAMRCCLDNAPVTQNTHTHCYVYQYI